MRSAYALGVPHPEGDCPARLLQMEVGYCWARLQAASSPLLSPLLLIPAHPGLSSAHPAALALSLLLDSALSLAPLFLAASLGLPAEDANAALAHHLSTSLHRESALVARAVVGAVRQGLPDPSFHQVCSSPTHARTSSALRTGILEPTHVETHACMCLHTHAHIKSRCLLSWPPRVRAYSAATMLWDTAALR
jgi:hypothetical protein